VECGARGPASRVHGMRLTGLSLSTRRESGRNVTPEPKRQMSIAVTFRIRLEGFASTSKRRLTTACSRRRLVRS
jgi:hypothetical protein